MLAYPKIDPIAFQVGPVAIHWYGIMYLIGIGSAWCLLTYRIRFKAYSFSAEDLSEIIFYSALGIIAGGRLGYMMFYNFPYFIQSPLSLFKIWEGGMSFHGGFIGVLIALNFCSKKIHKPFLKISDFIAPVVPLGLGAGRIGNFINGELWGRVTSSPFGIIFPTGGDFPRHPSQLYEFLLEGVLMFLLLWGFSRKKRATGAVSSLFLMCYGFFRFIAEFFRQPDAQIGFFPLGLTEGQLLSLPMLVLGLCLFYWSYKVCPRPHQE